jgi:hypothetical protein
VMSNPSSPSRRAAGIGGRRGPGRRSGEEVLDPAVAAPPMNAA